MAQQNYNVGCDIGEKQITFQIRIRCELLADYFMMIIRDHHVGMRGRVMGSQCDEKLKHCNFLDFFN